jgi:hypothetical protein
MTIAGARLSASRTAVVERFAPMATLAVTIIATTATHPRMSHDDLNAAFTMISPLLWSGVDVLERQ